jgi:hypothetical protein
MKYATGNFPNLHVAFPVHASWNRALVSQNLRLNYSYQDKKVKVKKSLFLTKHLSMKTYWWSGGIAPYFFNLSTRWR